MTAAKLCTFAVGPLLVGVDVQRVREVRRGDEVVPVPLAPPSVSGLANLRGEIVTVVDARARLGVDDRARGADAARAQVCVVIESAGEAVCLAVDEERDVVDVDPAGIEAVPATVSPTIASLVTGVHTVEGALLLVLDADRALKEIT